MTQFKIGDKVKRTALHSHSGMSCGDIGTIKGFKSDTNSLIFVEHGDWWGFDPANYALVEPAPKDLLFEGCVVQTRDEGNALYTANKLLYRDGHDVLCHYDEDLKSGVNSIFDIMSIRKVCSGVHSPSTLSEMLDLRYSEPVWTREEKTKEELQMEAIQSKITELQAEYDKLKDLKD